MRRTLLLVLCLASVGLAETMPMAIVDGEASDLAPSALALRMHTWAAALQDPKRLDAREAFPSAWRARTREGEYSISSAPVVGSIARADRKAAGEWLTGMAEQLESYSAGEGSSNLARARLRTILQRPEFAPTPPPSPLTKLIERFNAFLVRMLQRLFGGLSRHVTGGWQVFYGVLALCFLGLGWFGYRALRERQLLTGRGTALDSDAPAMRAWQQWLAAAEAALADGDFRKAIQCAYWAGVMRLQEAGDLPRETTRTPREYLRLLTGSSSKIGTLRQLTSALERFWYGGMTATAEDVRACFETVDKLADTSGADRH